MSYQIEAPEDVPEFAWPAWLSCLQWALGKDEIRASFEADTGKKWSAARCALDLMIDDATGWREDYMKAFVGWFNENVWGKWDDLPETMPVEKAK